MTSFAERLRQEFALRKERNARYSLRAFARLLGADHATVAQIFLRKRRVPVSRIHTWAERLGLSKEEAQAYLVDAHVDPAALARQQQIRQWSAEALAVVTDRVHFEILRLTRLPGFQADSRWIAGQSGATVDEVNIAVQRLLRLGLLDLQAGGEWRDLTGASDLTETAFRRIALARVRKLAASSQKKSDRSSGKDLHASSSRD